MHFAALTHSDLSQAALNAAQMADEHIQVQDMRAALQAFYAAHETAITHHCGELIHILRKERKSAAGIDNLQAEYPLATPEGQSLLVLAESLLRIPDHAMRNRLLRDVLSQGNWQQHTGHSQSWPINLATRGLQIGKELSRWPFSTALMRLAAEFGLDWMSHAFIQSDTIINALESRNPDLRYSFDMLGESALSEADAERYLAAYNSAIHQTGLAALGTGPWYGPGISIKLSALHSHFDRPHYEHLQQELYPRLLELAEYAKSYDIGLTIDAEESERSAVLLAMLTRLAHEPSLTGWDGLGVAVQAYQKQSLTLIDLLQQLARQTQRRLMVRLVKGAYWDSEIKRAQVLGLPYYPVFTHKAHTDLSYLACAQAMLAASNWLFPQFATHNPHTLCAIHQMAGTQDIEFQYLYGMGEPLQRAAMEKGIDRPWRVYAPVGNTKVLLPYLVRRLLENGANSSFVHQLFSTSTAMLCQMPKPDALLPLPTLAGHQSPPGVNLSCEEELRILEAGINTAASCLQIGQGGHGKLARRILNPANPDEEVGVIVDSNMHDIEQALTAAQDNIAAWQAIPVVQRADLLDRAANLLEQRRGELLLLLCREAGKTLPDAIDEWREAIDYCRYYAQTARQNWPQQAPQALGVVAAISPWNFPLAIFMGQIAAALVTGNCVIAKPAQETPLIAARALRCLHEAGIPTGVLRLLTGPAPIGATLVADPRCDGIVFTGSLATARNIRSLIASHERVKPLVAETGGVNVMLADSSIHIEQSVKDILRSAFNSAGQRCSALRVLCVQEEIADTLLAALQAAISELHLGDPLRLDTDLGPLISNGARIRVQAALEHFHALNCPVWQPDCLVPQKGFFIRPTLVQISTLDQIPGEIFGPVLCVLRYRHRKLKTLLAQIKQRDDTLTLGIQSRSREFQQLVIANTRAGNYYINRNQIGAMVACQPFGGSGQTGTGPKAGGPWYLSALVRDHDPCPILRTQDEPPDLQGLAREWPNIEKSADLFRRLIDYAERTPVNHETPLPGPTGEKNRQTWRARGLVACMGPGAEEMANQAYAALLTGNVVLLPGSAASQAIYGYLSHLAVQIHRAPLLHPDLKAVLYNGDDTQTIESLLAQRSGTITPLITPLASGGYYPLFRLVTECTISINTAACGGDVELLARDPNSRPSL